jgi:hypothetical protein
VTKKSMGFAQAEDTQDKMESSLVGFMSSLKDKRKGAGSSEFDALKNNDKKAAYLSPDWDTFVMSQFDSSELAEGHPKVNGLRRVAELLLGDIISSSPMDVHPVTPRDETQRSTVGYSITFAWFDGTERVYGDVADVWSGNQDPDFLIYSVATAATRAEGRALRKALKLKKCTAEEISGSGSGPKPKSEKARDVVDITESISVPQIKFLDKRCKGLDIDVMKFINRGEESYDVIEEMTKAEAKEAIDVLADMASEKVKLDSSLKGYDPSWRD